MRRLLPLVAALLACGLIAAGCGDDDDDGGDGSAATTVETTDTPADDYSGGTDEEAVEEMVETCKRGVQTSGQDLSEDLRNDIEDLCEEAPDADEDDLREASLDICKRVVEESVPDGPAREQALESCEQSVPTP